MSVLVLVCLLFALIPALLFLKNQRLYQPPQSSAGETPRQVSVLIPARNEEQSIGPAVEAALASKYVDLEVVVLDDHSEDRTAAIVSELAQRDGRVRLVSAPTLPAGWCGKQHACHVLSLQARYDLLLFVDADVRLRPDGLVRMVGFLEQSGAELVSGVPQQETGTLLEKLLIPLIHFILLGFLPLSRMRQSSHPAYAAGCGQLFLARRPAYLQAGGHAAIRTSLHDGITLPRAFRRAGFLTDLCDATTLATCRMYRRSREVWFGLAKNATEGMAAPATIVPFSVLLLGGQVLPLILLATFPLWSPSAWLLLPLILAVGAAYTPRLIGARRFRQSPLGALLHPLGVLLLLSIQWYALARKLLGRPAGWKGRRYQAVKPESANVA